MPIPSLYELTLPALRFATSVDTFAHSDLREHLAQQFAVSPEERSIRSKSGVKKFQHRVHWAVFELFWAELLERPKRATFRITDRGRSVANSPPEIIDRAYLKRFDEYRKRLAGKEVSPPERTDDAAASKTPEEQLEVAFAEIRGGLIAEISTRLHEGTPEFFERVVLDVMTGMGYGGSRDEAAQHLGRAGDDGVDGVISEDRLGLDSIYLQAKRWQNPVGRPEVQKFCGSLEGQRARKGVLITTSNFTSEAREYVKRIERRIVLIDGLRLAELMLDYGVGVTTRANYAIHAIDEDYFDESA